MREPKPTPGGRALLFERLVDKNPAVQQEQQPFRIHNREALRESVRREVSRLLNTRRARLEPLDDESERTVLAYGLPDFSWLSPAKEADRNYLAVLIERAVAAYEPRLRQIHIILEPAPQNPVALRGRIEARLIVGTFNEPVWFPMLIQTKDDETRVLELA